MKRHAPATERNREAIIEVLAGLVPLEGGMVLEIASGTGEHVAAFARRFPTVTWQPSDPDPEARDSIAAWCADVPNVFPPLAVDAASADWPIEWANAIVCINMVHISPWSATVGLFTQSSKLLPPGGPLILYGPYFRKDHPTAPTNLAFDESLRARNAEWGVRWLEDVIELAEAKGFSMQSLRDMPANNLTLIYRKA